MQLRLPSGAVTDVLRLVDLAAQVEAAPARAGATRVVAVDGPSGSGKTSLAARLSGVLHGAPVLHMDDLYPGWDGLADAPPRLLAWVLEPLARGNEAAYRRWDWAAGEYAEWHQLGRPPVLVVEGCGCGVRPVAAYLSLLLWLEAPTEERLRRGLARDGEAYRPYWDRWARQERALFAAEGTRERADLRVDGEGPHGSDELLLLP